MKLISVIAIVGTNVGLATASALADGYKQNGHPFRFSKFTVAPLLEQASDEVWFGATDRKPMKHIQRSQSSEPTAVSLHTDITFPSPFDHPEKCVSFPSLSHTWICDPDKILTPEEQKFVEARLLKLRDTTHNSCEKTNFYQAAVAVASDIVVNENETSQEATDRFANSLLRKWGVGNKGCHDGMVLAFVKNLKTVSLATRENVDDRVSNAYFKNHVQHAVNNIFLSTGSPAAAVASGVELVNQHLPRPPVGFSWTATILLSLGGVYLASVLGVYYSINTLMHKRYAVEQ